MKYISLGSQRLSLRKARKDLRVQWKFLAPRHLISRTEAIEASEHAAGEPVQITALSRIDTILLLGSNDPHPAHHAAALYEQVHPYNPDIKIVASGKGGHATVPLPIFAVTEAEAYRQILTSLDIPGSSIITEPNSTNTGQNIQFSWERLQEIGITPTRVIIVQTPGAQLRANLTFEKQWPSTKWEYYISHPPLPDIDAMSSEEIGFHLIYALREIATILYYMHPSDPALQFIVRRTLPEDLLDLVKEYYNACSDKSVRINLVSVRENATTISHCFRKIFEGIESQLTKKQQ